MASISSGNTFSVASHSSSGMSGLVSGLDTDGMVEQMLSGTQNKIDKQEALKQQLTWKQEIYRELIGDINSFGNQFFGYDSATNFTSTNFFDMMVASTSSSAFKVTGTSSASTGVTSVIVKQLAANAKAVSSGDVSANSLSGAFNADALTKRTVVFEVGGVERSVDLSSEDAKDGGVYTAKSVINYLNSRDLGFTAAINGNGQLTLTGAPGKEIRVSGKSDAYGLSMLGLSAYGTAAAKKDSDGNEISRVLTGKFTAQPELKFQVALDGVSNYVTLDQDKVTEALGDGNWSGVIQDLNHQLASAYGTLNNGDPMLSVRLKSGSTTKFEFVAPGDGHQIQVAGNDLATALTGVVSSQSSRISTSIAMKDVNFKEALQGDEYKFTINDQQFTFTSEDSLYSVMKKINNSGAGVRVTYSALTDKFSIEATSAGSGDRIRMSQEEGNLLSAMFGSDNIAAASAVSSGMTGKNGTITGTENTSFPSDFSGGVFSMTVNGKEVKLNFPKLGEGKTYSKSEVMTQINRSLQQQFGYVKDPDATVDHAEARQQAIELVYLDDTNAFAIKVRNGASVTFENSGDENTVNLAGKMGLVGKSNQYTATATTTDGRYVPSDSELGTLEPGLKELINKGAVSLQVKTGQGGSVTTTGRFELDKQKLAALSDLSADALETLKDTFGIDVANADGSVNTTKLGALGSDNGNMSTTGFVEAGHNAVVVIDGVETERSSNNFTVNGLNFELKTTTQVTYYNADGTVNTDAAGVMTGADGKTYLTDADGVSLGIEGRADWKSDTVTTERDVDQIFEGVKSFVEEYNKLVEKLNTYIYQDPNYKSYAPLTSAQKKEMTDREIEKWEEKSKEGLLRNDSDISTLLSSMRLALYQKPRDATYALYDLGIETGSAFSDKKNTGKLTLDETKFKQMLASDPEALRQLFTDSEEGLATKLKSAVDAAAKLSSGSAGSLVKLAGMSGYATDKNNTITNQITEINQKIKDLNSKYEKERQRYWNQFNAMEQLIQQMNSQSSWLSQQFSM